MRLWTLHPRYLDARGLVAAWPEALSPRRCWQEVSGDTITIPACSIPFPLSARSAMAAFLTDIAEEAQRRGYSFRHSKSPP